MKIILTEEQFKHLISEVSTSEIDAECKNVNLTPTDAQKEAGNYKMGHFSVKGMPISIENPKGSIRKYKNDKGYGEVTMQNHYGYFRNTSGNGKDGDAVDVFIGPYPDDFDKVYVIDQNNKDGEFDESKVMIGFKSKEEAKSAYLSNYNKGWTGFRTITGVSLRLFKKWLYRGNKQRKPFADYVEIQKKKLEESKLNESAYIDRIKGKKAMIHYEKNGDNGTDRAKGNLLSGEKLKTDLMDKSNNDTYKVQLKGGLMSYNITSIKGEYVMQYFKHYFDSQKAEAEIGGKKYEMDMEANEFNDFMNQFKRKIEIVVEDYMKDLRMRPDTEFRAISIYPIKSSSNFNVKMAQELSKLQVCGMQIQAIDTNILTKDLNNLQIDSDFVRMNQGFYDSPRSKRETSVMNFLQNDINRSTNIQKAQQTVNLVNLQTKKILNCIQNLKYAKNKEIAIDRIAEHYKLYADYIKQIIRDAHYHNEITDEDSKVTLYKIIKPIKYSKGPSIENRTIKIIEMIKTRLWGERSKIDGEPYLKNPYEICEWRPSPFEIKKISNGERMGLRNIYRFDDDPHTTSPETIKHVQEELERIKGTLFIVFDDNISGGSTLSDVCYQFMQKGIEKRYMLPITFGQMSESWTLGRIPLFKPEGGFNFTNDPSLSPSKREVSPEEQEIKKLSTNIEYGSEFVNGYSKRKQNLKILWVDDTRKPFKQFELAAQGKQTSKVGMNNQIAFVELMKKYNIMFDCVHNYTEFVEYIQKNGVPEFISFDRDLGAASTDGKSSKDCAIFLVNYCKQHGEQIPMYYIHSANSSAFKELTNVLSTNTLFVPQNKNFSFDIPKRARIK